MLHISVFNMYLDLTFYPYLSFFFISLSLPLSLSLSLSVSLSLSLSLPRFLICLYFSLTCYLCPFLGVTILLICTYINRNN